MNPTSGDKERWEELLKKIPTSCSYDAAQYASEVSKLADAINVGQSLAFAGDVSVASALNASSNVIQQANDPEVKAALQRLVESEKSLISRLDTKPAERVVRALELFIREATAEHPRRKWLDLSAEDLLEAAKSVNDLSGPIAAAIMDIVKRVAS